MLPRPSPVLSLRKRNHEEVEHAVRERVDVPEGLSRETKARIHKGLHDAIAKSWFKEHIWIAIRDMYAEPGDKTVLLSCGVRPGRGQEAERTKALFDYAHRVMEKEIGTSPEEMICIVHEFEQHMCISGGDQLPPLDGGTPELERVLEPA